MTNQLQIVSLFARAGGLAIGFEKAGFSTIWAINGEKVGDLFLYVLLSEMKGKIGSDYFEGTALKHLQKPKLKSLALKLPPAAVEPLFAEIGFLTRENQTLAATRDKLLRKLIK
jgi:type I restriction enzyme S subunit